MKRTLVLTLLLAIAISTIAMAEQLSLVELWRYNTNDDVNHIVFADNGLLGLTSGNCAYILDQNGKLVTKTCGNSTMTDVSYCCGVFGFSNQDDNVYLYFVNNSTWRKMDLTSSTNFDGLEAITLTKDGFVVCEGGCTFFYFNGTRAWSIDFRDLNNGVVNPVEASPVYYDGYWYIPSYRETDNYPYYSYGLAIWKPPSWLPANETLYGTYDVTDLRLCGKYLGVLTNYGPDNILYVYVLDDPTKPKEIMKKYLSFEHQIAFSPDCNYIAVAGVPSIGMININGTSIGLNQPIAVEPYNSIDWYENKIAVGTSKGVIVFKLEESTNTPATVSTTSTSPTSSHSTGVPAPILLSLFGGIILRRRKGRVSP